VQLVGGCVASDVLRVPSVNLLVAKIVKMEFDNICPKIVRWDQGLGLFGGQFAFEQGLPSLVKTHGILKLFMLAKLGVDLLLELNQVLDPQPGFVLTKILASKDNSSQFICIPTDSEIIDSFAHQINGTRSRATRVRVNKNHLSYLYCFIL
jgi:hypothetical protein